MANNRFNYVLSAFNIIAIIFVLSPIVVVIASSFGETLYMRFPPQGFTLKWYEKALTDPGYWSAFYTSIHIGVAAAVTATLVGGGAAWVLARYNVIGRSAIESALLLPLTLPHLILAIAILTLTQPMGLGGSLTRLVVAHIVITIPYVIRILLPVITELSAELEEAAADLGALPSVIFRTVTLPILAPSLVVCFAVSFVVSFDELVLALFLSPPTERTIQMQIFTNVEFALDPSVGALSTMLLAATFILMLIGQVIAKKLSVKLTQRNAH